MTDIGAGQRLTGERTLPHIWHENYWFRRHEAAYAHVAGLLPAAGGGIVVDAGCGEGYGSALLAATGPRRVVAVDYDSPTLSHLRASYPDLVPVKGNLVALPFTDGSVDAVVSLQVVEHIWEQQRFVGECCRLVRTHGLLALSTPNRVTFSPGLARGEKPLNPFHANELDAEELVALLPKEFGVLALEGLHHGARVAAYEARHGPLVHALLAEAYQQWPETLVRLVRSLTAADFVVRGDGIATSLDLLVVARRE